MSGLVGGKKGSMEGLDLDGIDQFWLPLARKLIVEASSRIVRRLGAPHRKDFLSPAVVATGLLKQVNAIKPDVVNLHWLGHDTLSIREIGGIEAPVVWTLHDEWFFRGAEHYAEDLRPFSGYQPAHDFSGILFDLNKMVWDLKRRYWTRPMHLVTSSTWLKNMTEDSLLGRNHTVHHVPLPLDSDYWKPMTKAEAAKILNLDPAVQYILSGSAAADRDFRKGRDLVIEALEKVRWDQSLGSKTEVLFFGGRQRSGTIGQFRFNELGTLRDNQLRAAYSLSNLTLIGSRREAFGQVATESSACGTPVVCFSVGGLIDIVGHHRTGLLVEPFDTSQMARFVETLILDPDLASTMGRAARSKVKALCSPDQIQARYFSIFEEAIQELHPRSG